MPSETTLVVLTCVFGAALLLFLGGKAVAWRWLQPADIPPSWDDDDWVRTLQMTRLDQPVRRADDGPVSDAEPPVITGRVVEQVPLPEPRAGVLARIEQEMSDEWHWLGGQILPPARVVDSLPAGDWLRELLEAS